MAYIRWNSNVSGLYKKKQKIGFLLQTFMGRLRNSPLRTEYNDLHDQEDYRMTFLAHPSVWRQSLFSLQNEVFRTSRSRRVPYQANTVNG